MNNQQTEKQLLRQHIRSVKGEYDTLWKENASEQLFQRLISTDLFQEAKCLLLYHALNDEVQTESFLKKWFTHKEIILPVVEGDHLILKKYDPVYVKTGSYGIQEPQGEIFIDTDRIDLALIPGMGFDRKGNRLGRGKGFYDRLLPALKAQKIGVGFSWQIFEAIPIHEFDHPLDGIITEKEFFFTH